MFAVVVGGGKVGSYLAQSLLADGHQVLVVDKRSEICEKLTKEAKAKVFQGDACDPEQFGASGVVNADLVAAVTGHDEDNLVVSQLAKYTFKVPRVIAKVNNPRNEWLFTSEWGVDVAVSAVHIIAKIIQEEASLGDIVTLLKLRKGELALVEASITASSGALDVEVKNLDIPSDTVLVAILRDEQILVPKGNTKFLAGDRVLAITSIRNEPLLAKILG